MHSEIVALLRRRCWGRRICVCAQCADRDDCDGQPTMAPMPSGVWSSSVIGGGLRSAPSDVVALLVICRLPCIFSNLVECWAELPPMSPKHSVTWSSSVIGGGPRDVSSSAICRRPCAQADPDECADLPPMCCCCLSPCFKNSAKSSLIRPCGALVLEHLDLRDSPLPSCDVGAANGTMAAMEICSLHI